MTTFWSFQKDYAMRFAAMITGAGYAGQAKKMTRRAFTALRKRAFVAALAISSASALPESLPARQITAIGLKIDSQATPLRVPESGPYTTLDSCCGPR